ncbi:hypothetical protein ANCCAN_12475 [Ancylostoma caninum]|uniref:Uncharacterized protein n=1 Tax=Ancylostoma caninum TaxID=29170 RepID=A0A368GAY2_ANCCA|nr:hypothetical protein ANCCAN_12475 [Ancylostoma caninum]
MKNEFYGLLQDTIDEAPQRDLKIVLEDFNAQLRGDRHGIKRTVGPFSSSEHLSDNGERLIPFCDRNDLCAGNAYFQHRATLKPKLKQQRPLTITRPFAVEKLKDPVVANSFNLELRNRFKLLRDTNDIEENWAASKALMNNCAEKFIGGDEAQEKSNEFRKERGGKSTTGNV